MRQLAPEPFFTVYARFGQRSGWWWGALGLAVELELCAREVVERGYISAEDELCRLGAILLDLTGRFEEPYQ